MCSLSYLSGLSHLDGSDYPSSVISTIKSIGITPHIGFHGHHAMF